MLNPVSRLVAATTLVLLSSCGADTVAPVSGLEGEYALDRVNGIALPFLKEETASQRVEVVSGSLLLRSNRTYSGTIVEQWTSGGTVQSFPETSAGTYSVSGSQLTFTESGSGAVYLGTMDGARITATLIDVTFRFVKQ